MIYMLSLKEQQEVLDEWKRSHHIGAAGLKVLNKKKYKDNNLQFSKTDKNFKNACDKAQVQNTQRQASKFRNEYGKAFRFK